MCQTFESGKMVPDAKRGGDVEFSFVKDAIKLVNFQVSEAQEDLIGFKIIMVLFRVTFLMRLFL